MTYKIKKKFEKEYGKKRGDRIFFAWEYKNGILQRRKKKR